MNYVIKLENNPNPHTTPNLRSESLINGQDLLIGVFISNFATIHNINGPDQLSSQNKTTFLSQRNPRTKKNSKMALAFVPSISSSSPPPRLYSSPPPPFLHLRRSRGSSVSNLTPLFVRSRNLTAPESSRSSLDLGEINESCKRWKWRGFSINFFSEGNGPPLLLVHGFGASIGHWRR